MRTIQAFFLVGVSLLSTGCSSKQIQLYARKLETYLTEYRATVKSQIDAERKVYDQVSAVLATEAERGVYEGLKLERLRQQRVVSGDLAEGRLQPSQVIEKIRESAIREFDTSRAWFDQELTAQRQYQAGLSKLAVDTKKLDALDSALKAVEKNGSLKSALADIVQMEKSFRGEFQLQGCRDLERSAGITKVSLAELTANKTALEKSRDAATGDEKAQLVAAVKAVEAQIADVTATQTATLSALAASQNFKADPATPNTKKCQ